MTYKDIKHNEEVNELLKKGNLFLFSDRNASDCMIQTFLLYRANVKSEIRNVSGICKIASAHRFYRNLIATASKSSYNWLLNMKKDGIL